MIRPGPDIWRPLGRPDYLRAAAEASLRRLGVETLDLCYLHRVDPTVPLADQVGTLTDMVTEGKIAHIGLSKVSPEQIAAATATVRISAVQNCLNIAEPDDPVLTTCSERGIPYVAYRPLNVGRLPVGKALAWLLNLSALVAAIPGTSNPEHLDELVEALRDREA